MTSEIGSLFTSGSDDQTEVTLSNTDSLGLFGDVEKSPAGDKEIATNVQPQDLPELLIILPRSSQKESPPSAFPVGRAWKRSNTPQRAQGKRQDDVSDWFQMLPFWVKQLFVASLILWFTALLLIVLAIAHELEKNETEND